MPQDGLTLDVRGLRSAARALEGLERKARRRVCSAAVRAGNGVFIKEARRLAPYRTGQMRRQIRGSVKMQQASGTVVGTVQPRSTKKERRKGQKAHAAHLVVGGTKPHVIRARSADSLRFGRVYVEQVNHPGARANPFMERAANTAFRDAVKAFDKKYAERLDVEARKARASQGDV